MDRYDYLEAVKQDVRDYIQYEVDLKEYEGQRELLETELQEGLWTNDSVTGNGSGSYTFSAWQAEEYVAHNLDLLGEALEEFGDTSFSILKEGAEAADVTIRCYLLNRAVSEVLDEIYGEEDEQG